VAGDEQQDAGGDQVVLRQLLDRGQAAEQVLSRFGPAPTGQLAKVRAELRPCPVAPGELLVRDQEVRVEPAGQRVGPGAEAVLVLRGYAEQLADHDDRQGVGE
jgi:hypothetical protein